MQSGIYLENNFGGYDDGDGIQSCNYTLTIEEKMGSWDSEAGLKLGKRTYNFEHSSSSSSQSSTCIKKTKSASGPPIICCQVEGCNIDLSKEAKEYHRKHRVCDTHSKSPTVIVGGRHRRFCQQCSRFHSLSEFDENKRSCRTRLSHHNARRRKPHIIHSTPPPPPPYYYGNQQMSFLQLNNSPAAADISACNSKFTLTQQGYSSSINDEHTINQSKNLISNPGCSKGMISSSSSEFGRALSLLSSSNSWDSESIPTLHENDMVHAIPPLHFWLTGGQQSTPYDAAAANFYSNILN